MPGCCSTRTVAFSEILEGMIQNNLCGEKRIVSLQEFRERPDECECTPLLGEIPCWPCYREGFETPNPGIEKRE